MMMVLGEFLKGVEEAGYLVNVNAGNSFLTLGGYGRVTIGSNTIVVGGGFLSSADLEGIVDEPVLDYNMIDDTGKYSKTGHFTVGGVVVDITHTFTSNKCQCCTCNA